MQDLKRCGGKLKLFLIAIHTTKYFLYSSHHGWIIDWQEIGLVVFLRAKGQKQKEEQTVYVPLNFVVVEDFDSKSY